MATTTKPPLTASTVKSHLAVKSPEEHLARLKRHARSSTYRVKALYESSEPVMTVAGSGVAGYADGAPNTAKFYNPYGVAVDADGNLYIADYVNQRIRKVTPDGTVSTFLAAGAVAYPTAIAIGSSGNIFVADVNYNTGVAAIKKVTVNGVVTEIAQSNDVCMGLAVDGNDTVYYSDTYSNVVRKVTSGGVQSTVAGNGIYGFTDGPASSAMFKEPAGLSIDGGGNVYVADSGNHRIRKIGSDGTVSTFAGSGAGYADGTGAAAKFDYPYALSGDQNGNLTTIGYYDSVVRKITPDGTVTSIAGSGVAGFADGVGSAAQFNYVIGLCLDARRSVIYVADTENNRIRRIGTPQEVVSVSLDPVFDHISPNGDNRQDYTRVNIHATGPWALTVEGSSTAIATGTGNATGNDAPVWDGRRNGTALPDGTYTLIAGRI